MARPTLVVVSGPPGSGKTTLAHALARAIPCPAIVRDEIKEGMVHAAGSPFDDRELTQRTFILFFDVVRTLVAGGVTVVAEAAFQDFRWRPSLEPLREHADVRVVRCRMNTEAAYERVLARGARGAHQQLPPSSGDFAHVQLDVPTLDVDTTDGYAPPLDEIVAFVSRRS